MRKAMFAAVLSGACAVACAAPAKPPAQAKAGEDSVVEVVPKRAPIAAEAQGQCLPLENGGDWRGVKIRPALPGPDWKVAVLDAPEFNGVRSDLSLLNSQTRTRIIVDLYKAEEMDELFLRMRKAIASRGGKLGPIETFTRTCETVQAFLALAGKDAPVGNIVGLVRSKRHPRIGIFFIGFWPHTSQKGSGAIANEIANMAVGLRLYR